MIYTGDALEVLKTMEDGSVDCCITSPPYNMRTRVRNGEYTTREKTEHFCKKYHGFGDDLTIGEFYGYHLSVMEELIRVCKIVLYNFQIVTGSKEAFFKIIGEMAKYIKDIIVWNKAPGQPAMHDQVMNADYELILVLESPSVPGRCIQSAVFKRGTMGNVWEVARENNNESGHSAAMPLALANKLVLNFTVPGQTVIDPFCGIGTSGVACAKHGVNFIGIELVPEYVAIAEKRIDAATKQGRLF